jgi:sarcosine oxidase
MVGKRMKTLPAPAQEKQLHTTRVYTLILLIFEPNAGVLRPEKCISSQLGLAHRAGAVLHVNETVTGIEEAHSHVLVKTDKSHYPADRVIVAAGAWIGHFMPPDLAASVRTYRQVLYWYDIDPHAFDALAPGNFPVFVWQRGSDSHQMFYGFPAVDGAAAV